MRRLLWFRQQREKVIGEVLCGARGGVDPGIAEDLAIRNLVEGDGRQAHRGVIVELAVTLGLREFGADGDVAERQEGLGLPVIDATGEADRRPESERERLLVVKGACRMRSRGWPRSRE